MIGYMKYTGMLTHPNSPPKRAEFPPPPAPERPAPRPSIEQQLGEVMAKLTSIEAAVIPEPQALDDYLKNQRPGME
jgi:hypothetical protein